MTTRIDVTDHAVLRYVQRHARGTPHDQARAEIERLAGGATPLRERTVRGQQMWRVSEPPMLLVVKPDGGRYVCVTVLPSTIADEEDAAIEAEIVEAYARIRHLVERGSDENPADTKAVQDSTTALCTKLRAQIDSLKTARDALRSDLHKICNFSASEFSSLSAGEQRHALNILRAQYDAAERRCASKHEDRRVADTLRAQLAALQQTCATKHENRHESDNLRAQLASVRRKHSKQIEHGLLMSKERNQTRLLLAAALRGLARSSDPDARAVFDAITAADPTTASTTYWDREVALKGPPQPSGSDSGEHTCTVCFDHHVPEPCCPGCDCDRSAR